MTGEARFTYTDEDMIAAQSAGWTWFARWRNLLIAYAVLAICNGALFAALDARFGTRAIPADDAFVIVGSAVESILVFGATLWLARRHGRDVLRSRKLGMPWNGDELGGEHAWTWDTDHLQMRNDRGRADLAWTVVGAWLDAPKVLLLFPAGGRAFSTPEPALAAGWTHAPKVYLFPCGGHALALPKRALAAGDGDRLRDLLRRAGVPERRRFGLIATTGGDAREVHTT